MQLVFQPLEYRVREEEGRLPLTILQIGESERPVLFSVAYNETTSTATSMAKVKHRIIQLPDSVKEDGIFKIQCRVRLCMRWSTSCITISLLAA